MEWASVGHISGQICGHRACVVFLAAYFCFGSGIGGDCLAQTAPSATVDPFSKPASPPKTTSPDSESLSSYEGQNVSSIEIAGRPDADPSQFSSLFVQQPGQPFSEEKVDKTVSVLKAKTHAETVRVQVDPEADGVRVELILEPAVYFGIFQFPGAEHFPYSQLVQIANYPIQTPFNRGDIDQAQQGLLKFFQQEGYFTAQVEPHVDVDQSHGIANVRFQTKLGRRAAFGVIKIGDMPPEETADLTHRLQTAIARLRGAGIRPGKAYHHSTIAKAAKYLQALLEKRGYLSAEVKPEGAEYHADSNRADIHFTIKTGQLAHVDILGAHLWSWNRKALLPFYQGVGVEDESVQEGERALTSWFQSKGYFDVKVESQVKSEGNGETVVYSISKEKKHKVAQVKISGNKALPASQLTPHLAVERKHLFSSGKFSDQLVRASVKNLTRVYQSEGFSSVKVVSSVTNRGSDIQVSFRVDEGPRDIVSSLEVEGTDTLSRSQYAPNGLKLEPGKPYSQANVQADRASISEHYLQAGYLNSSFRETATAVSKDDPPPCERCLSNL